MVGTAVLKLGGSNVQNAFPCAGRDHVDEAQQILTGIPEPHAAADAALVIAGTAAHVEGDHALILVPQAHHPVQLFLAGGQLPAREQLLPVVGQCPAGGIHLCVGGIAGHHGLCPGFVDDAGSAEFFPDRVFNVAQPEDDALFLARCQCEMEMVGTHRSPAVGNAVRAVTGFDRFRCGGAAVHAAEGIPAGVEAGNGGVGPEHSVVIPALPVLCLMIDGTFHHFHLAGGKVALEIGAVVHGIPQAELHIAEHVQRAGGSGLVFQRQPVDLTGIAPGHEQLLSGRNAVFFALQDRVAKTVAAGVTVQFRLGGLPARVPDGAAIVDVDAVAVHVQRGIVVAVAGQAAHPGVPVKAVTARCVGDQTEEVLTAKVVDPGQGRLRGGDDVFLILVIKISELHNASSLKLRLVGRAVCR